MNALNEVIAADTKNLGPGYQIGHSYFCPRNGIKPGQRLVSPGHRVRNHAIDSGILVRQ